MLLMLQKSPRIYQEKYKRVTLYIYRIREHFLQHVNITSYICQNENQKSEELHELF